MNRDQAIQLVREYTSNENLVKHMLSVGAAMRGYAKKLGLDEQEFEVCGILHDFDYEKMGAEHPSEWGYEILRSNDVSEEIIDAIKGHASSASAEDRNTQMSKTLFAVDELSGFVVACSLPRPNQISDLSVKSVKKKLKDKTFAAKVNREDIHQGVLELDVELDEHIVTVIESIKLIKEEIGLR